LREITLPPSVRTIEEEAFGNWLSFQRIIAGAHWSTQSSFWRSGWSADASIVWNDGAETSGTLLTGYSGKSDTLNVPDFVTEIRNVSSSELTRIIIPASVTTIADNAFDRSTNLTQIETADETRFRFAGGKLYDMAEMRLIFVTHGLSGDAEILDGTLSILHEVFANRTGIDRITIPASVNVLGAGLFRGNDFSVIWHYNPNMSSSERIQLTLSNRVRQIVIPQSVTSVPVGTFDSFRNMEIIWYYNRDLDTSHFQNRIVRIIIPHNVTGIPSGTIDGFDTVDIVWHYNMNFRIMGPELSAITRNLVEVIIPEGAEIAPAAVFAFAPRLSSITLPDSVTSIQYRAFGGGAQSLKQITFPPNLRSIGIAAFDGSGLSEIWLPESLEWISEGAFSGTNIQSVFIPCNVRHIGPMAFPEDTQIIISPGNPFLN